VTRRRNEGKRKARGEKQKMVLKGGLKGSGSETSTHEGGTTQDRSRQLKIQQRGSGRPTMSGEKEGAADTEVEVNESPST